MKSGLVSVVMPVYNASPFLREAIDSILNQTYPLIELIVINDGSNDAGKTENIILSYGNKVKYIKKENGGVASAINMGIAYANGEFIARMDADDISLPTRIELQVKYMQNHPDIGVCGTRYKRIDNLGRIQSIVELPLEHEVIKASLI